MVLMVVTMVPFALAAVDVDALDEEEELELVA